MSTTHFSGPVAVGSGSIESLAAAKTLTADNNGMTYFLNLAGGFTVTLPTPAAGLRYKFIVKTAPTTAYIISDGGNDTIIGGFSSSELTDAAVMDYDAAGDQVNFVASNAVVGDWCEFISDGTSWYVSGHANVQAGMTITG